MYLCASYVFNLYTHTHKHMHCMFVDRYPCTCVWWICMQVLQMEMGSFNEIARKTHWGTTYGKIRCSSKVYCRNKIKVFGFIMLWKKSIFVFIKPRTKTEVQKLCAIRSGQLGFCPDFTSLMSVHSKLHFGWHCGAVPRLTLIADT